MRRRIAVVVAFGVTVLTVHGAPTLLADDQACVRQMPSEPDVLECVTDQDMAELTAGGIVDSPPAGLQPVDGDPILAGDEAPATTSAARSTHETSVEARLRAQLARERARHRQQLAAARYGWTPAINRQVGRGLAAQTGWVGAQWRCLDRLWGVKESGWLHTARNPQSGALGIPQALPGRKMATIAADYRTNPVTQIRWGIRYIGARYGTPCKALTFHNQRGWY